MKNLDEFFTYAADFWGKRAAVQHGDITPGTPWSEAEADVEKIVKPLSEFVPTKTLDVVEIGCGEGRLARAFEPHFKSYTGVDVCGNCLVRAESMVANGCKFQLIRGLDDIPNADVYVSFTVFMHWPAWALWAFLARLRSKLPTGGMLAFQLNDRNTAPDHRFDMIPDADLWEGRWYPNDIVAARLRECGFNPLLPPTEVYAAWIAEAV